MRVIYRLFRFKTFPLFREKKVLEYSKKSKEDLIQMIRGHEEDHKRIMRVLNITNCRQEHERLHNYYIWQGHLISFAKEALKIKYASRNRRN